MQINEIIKENNREHARALQDTGFWGQAGAGCLFLALNTGHICIAHRSQYVEQPGTWGTWGGAIDANEDPESAARREVREEAGYHGGMKIIPLYVFSHSSGFRYYNFLAVVEEEFDPELDWETQGYEWVNYGDWPNPLHMGLVALLNDSASIQTIKKYANIGQKNSKNKTAR